MVDQRYEDDRELVTPGYRDASRASVDEAFHEIQLSGKQLVFLFMATTVVSVVIFLCGVLVGRGARPDVGTTVAAADRGPVGETTRMAPDDLSAEEDVEAGSGEPGGGTAEDDLSFHKRLDSADPPAERLPAAPSPAQVLTPATEQAPTAAPATGRAPAAAPTDPAAASGGLVVQVAAFRKREDADAVAKQLAGKGYPVYVVDPAPGAPVFYRVRVGTYDSRGEAEQIRRRLEREEQFKPWITR